MAAPRDAWESRAVADGRRGASAAGVLRQSMLWASRRSSIKRAITAAPVTRGLVQRFVAGEAIADAVTAARALTNAGLLATIDHLGEDTRDTAAATAAVRAYRSLIEQLADEGLTATTEVSLKLSAVGQSLDEQLALENAASVCDAARDAGTTVTVDMEDHTTTDSTLRIVARLREQHPSTGAVIQASLHRSPDDCRTLAHPGSRIRLCKGAYQEPVTVAWQDRREVRRAFLQCLRILIDGGALPMVASHDPLLIGAALRMFEALQPGGDHEFQMLFGIRRDEQRRLASLGERMRIYVPFGTQWYGYLMRRMAERPANLALVLRAAGSRR